MTNVVGNDELKTRLGQEILSQTLPHAYILEGMRGSGKHTIARMCAAALACESKASEALPIPCMQCPSCKKILEGKSPDLITVGTEGKATVGVDTVRILREDVHVIPNDLDYKIYIIEDADRMTVQAQNALLLTLEEPPSFVHFFLLCEQAGLLLETIRSRAPILRTEPIDSEKIDRYLCEHDVRAKQMKLASPEAYKELLLISRMGIGQALYYLEPKHLSPVLEARHLALDFVTAAVTSRDPITLLSRFSQKREEAVQELSLIADALRDLLLLKKSETVTLSFFTDFNAAIDLCDRVSLQFLYRFMEAIQAAMDSFARNANVKLSLIQMLTDANLI